MSFFPCHHCGCYMGLINMTLYPCACTVLLSRLDELCDMLSEISKAAKAADMIPEISET
jgi:hypothetical protein